MKLTLTNENYYSIQANADYMSVSQFKDFAGTIMHNACETTALKKANGIIQTPKTTPLLVGSYIDSYFEGTLDEFKAENPEIFKKTGDKGLKAEYVGAEEIINRINNDPLFTSFMSGQKQVIMTGNLFGVDWKIKMDSYHPDDKIVDLKVMRDMQPIWSADRHSRVDFIRYWGYDIQGAIYQKIVELNTGKKLPFYIACATKETPCDIEIIEITQPYLDAALKFVEDHIQHVMDVKNGIVQAEKCETCFYCKTSKILKQPVTIDTIIPANCRIDENGAEPEDEDAGADNHIQGYSLFDE
ncbi:PD-(D/E)XK nuclease-like domain-containing protein [bacterium]|nr:PD-(D/E)XK nuclease-like domain-containing protein [bacterium]